MANYDNSSQHANRTDVPKCDHPGIEHGFFSYTMVCPGCGDCKFIGHGPLCTDCYRATTDEATKTP